MSHCSISIAVMVGINNLIKELKAPNITIALPEHMMGIAEYRSDMRTDRQTMRLK